MQNEHQEIVRNSFSTTQMAGASNTSSFFFEVSLVSVLPLNAEHLEHVLEKKAPACCARLALQELSGFRWTWLRAALALSWMEGLSVDTFEVYHIYSGSSSCRVPE